MKIVTAKEHANFLKLTGSTAEQTREVLSTLTPREEMILRLRFGISERGIFGQKNPRIPGD